MGEERPRAVPAMTEARRRTHAARLLLRARASTGSVRERYENEVVRLHLDVALDLARRYHGRGLHADDLDQVACLGLVKAVRAFDATLGPDFLSFAVPTVRGELRRYFRDAGWVVRPPRSVQEAQAEVVGAEAELVQRLGRHPVSDEIATHLGIPESLVRECRDAAGCFHPVSLDAPHPVEETSPTSTLGAPDPAFASAEARVALQPLLAALDERERTMLQMRFFEHRTQAEIGAVVGLSQEQVSRALAGLLARLRRALDAA